jgi:hypothetical protein
LWSAVAAAPVEVFPVEIQRTVAAPAGQAVFWKCFLCW